MIFYVIGNGFDQHYGLDTSYYSFKKYLMSVNRKVVERIDELFYRYNMSLAPEDIAEWNKLEDMLAVFCQLDGDEIYEEALNNAENDDERADYFDSIAWNVEYYTKYIDILKQEFINWISQIDVNINLDTYFMPDKNDFILSFNYTETVENNYLVKKSNILHIHGKVGENLVVGHNEYQEPSLYNVVWDEDSDYRTIKAMEEVDNVLLRASRLYYKDSELILKHHIDFFEYIDKCDKVVILGLSCGLQDSIYVKEIVRRARKIDFFWFDESAKKRFQAIANSENFKGPVNFFKW